MYRSLFVLRSSPCPPIGGAPLRNWQNINAMANHGPVAIFSAFPAEAPAEKTLFGPWEHFHIQDMSYGEPDNWRDYLYSLRPWGHEACDRYYRPAAAEKLQSLLQSFEPNRVVFGEPWMYCYLPVVRAFAKKHPCKIIFDNHNVEARVSLYQDRLPRRPGVRGKIEARLRHQQVLNMERTLCRQAQQVWVCSEFDQTGLVDLYDLPRSKVKVVPNGIDITHFESVRSNRIELPAPLQPGDQAVLFAATFDYSANIWAAQWLLEEIYPLLQKSLPNLKLMLVGRAPTPLMQSASEANPNIIIPGLVDDILPYYRAASAIVVPLRHGSGTRLKLLEAFASERPVVSTTKGAEGLDVTDGEHLYLADTPETIAEKLIRLLQSDAQSKHLQGNAFHLVNQQHSWQVSQGMIDQALNSL